MLAIVNRSRRRMLHRSRAGPDIRTRGSSTARGSPSRARRPGPAQTASAGHPHHPVDAAYSVRLRAAAVGEVLNERVAVEHPTARRRGGCERHTSAAHRAATPFPTLRGSSGAATTQTAPEATPPRRRRAVLAHSALLRTSRASRASPGKRACALARGSARRIFQTWYFSAVCGLVVCARGNLDPEGDDLRAGWTGWLAPFRNSSALGDSDSGGLRHVADQHPERHAGAARRRRRDARRHRVATLSVTAGLDLHGTSDGVDLVAELRTSRDLARAAVSGGAAPAIHSSEGLPMRRRLPARSVRRSCGRAWLELLRAHRIQHPVFRPASASNFA